MDISIKNIGKEFQSQTALNDINLDIPSGQLTALLGPSGSGKTTLLRLIAGLDFPSRGQIFFGDADASNKPLQERHVGFVFQQYALFRHMTVFDNIAFGLSVRPRRERPAKNIIRERVFELLELVQLQGLEKRYPSQLSGGQRQRVALARALSIDPSVLLLDEPFGALDAKVRNELRRWLREVHEKTHYTTIFVTHDQDEALELADQVVVMSQGRIEQIGTPDEVYNAPATPYVYEFLGATNIFPVQVSGGQIYMEGFETSIAPAARSTPDGPASLYVRPHDFELTQDRLHSLPVVVQQARQTGGSLRIEVQALVGPGYITIELPHDYFGNKPLKPGTRILLKPRKFGLFPRHSMGAKEDALAAMFVDAARPPRSAALS